MNELLAQLDVLSSSNRVLHPDIAIHTKLTSFFQFLPEQLEEQERVAIETSLLNLLKINQGVLRIHVATKIGECLVAIYKHDKSMRFWNLIQLFKETATPANIIALSVVVRRIGSHSKSSLPGITEHLLAQKDTLHHYVLIALHRIIKVGGNVLQYNKQVFQLSKKYILSTHEPSQLAALLLMRDIVITDSSYHKKALSCMVSVFKGSFGPDVKELASQVVAEVAVSPIRHLQADKGPESDLEVKGNKSDKTVLEPSFVILYKFKSQFSIVIKSFLDLLSPEFVYNNALHLYKKIKSVNISCINRLTDFFGPDVRNQLFRNAMEHPSLPLLKLLAYDADTTREVSQIALSAMPESLPFFITLGVSYPEVASESAKYCIKMMKGPATSEIEYEYHSQVLYVILSVCKEAQRALLSESSLMEEVINQSTSDSQSDSILAANLLTMCSLPSAFSDRFEESFNFDKAFDMSSEISKKLLSSGLAYFSRRPKNVKALDLALYAIDRLPTLTRCELVSLIELSIKIDLPEGSKQTLIDFYSDLLQSLYITPQIIANMVSNPVQDTEESPVSYILLPLVKDDAALAQFLIDNLPRFLIPATSPALMLKLAQNLKLSSGLLLLSIYKRYSDIVPSGFHHILLKYFPSDNLRLTQIMSEILALHLSLEPTESQVITSLLTESRIASSGTLLLFSSISAHGGLPHTLIAALLQQMPQLLASKVLAPLALHTLCVVFEKQSIDLSALLVGDQICQTMLSAPPPSSSHSLRLWTMVVERIVPIVLPTLTTNVSINFMKMMLDLIAYSAFPISSEMVQIAVRSVAAFSRAAVSDHMPEIRFSKHSSERKLLALCGSMADLKIYPESVDSLFVLLQKTKDSRVYNLIVTSASQEDKKLEFQKICRKILSGGICPGFGQATAEPNTRVKCCALDALSVLVKQGGNRELLDDAVAAAVRAAETGIEALREPAYRLLATVTQIIDKNELELYESLLCAAARYSLIPSVNIDYAAPFLSSLMQLSSEAVNIVSGALGQVDRTTPGFLSVAARLSMIENNVRFPEVFDSFVKETIKLRSESQNWEKTALFRRNYSEMYREILSAAVMCCDVTPFLISEISQSSESWRISAAYEALCQVLEASGSEMQESLKYDVIKVLATASLRRDKGIFLKAAVRSLEGDNNFDWNQLAEVAVRGGADPATLAVIGRQEGMNKYWLQFADMICQSTDKGLINVGDAVAALTTMVQEDVIERILISETQTLKITLARRSKGMGNSKQLSDLFTESYSEGGIEAAGYILQVNPTKGLEIFNQGFSLYLSKKEWKDSHEAKISLLYLLSVMKHERISSLAVPVAIRALASFSEIECVSAAVSILRESGPIQQYWNDLPRNLLHHSLKTLNTLDRIHKKTKKKPKLAAISLNTRKKNTSDEWQDLETE